MDKKNPGFFAGTFMLVLIVSIFYKHNPAIISKIKVKEIKTKVCAYCVHCASKINTNKYAPNFFIIF